MTTIDDVRRFWDANPLFTGETRHSPGSREFFDEHRRIYYDDCFAGRLDPRLFPADLTGKKVLDLGCGVGFWLIELAERGATDLTGADLSPKSLEIARRRCEVYGVEAVLKEENAEQLSFADDSFDHVNCQGVVHHTTDPAKAVREIYRVLKPGGTATISVYYRNAVLRAWPLLRHVARVVPIGLKGRGRENMGSLPSADDIVRLYDGAGNPIGYSYDRRQFRQLLGPFEAEGFYFHFFPARAMPVRVPSAVHRLLDKGLPFMIYANVRKRG